MPIFTVILSKLFLNQTHSMLAYLSLLPIMGGVIICSITEIEFNLVGLLSALFSTFIFAVQNIFSKKVSDHHRPPLLACHPCVLACQPLGLVVFIMSGIVVIIDYHSSEGCPCR